MQTTIANKTITVVADEKGGELMSIKAGGIEYLWQGDPAVWPRRSPVLFPVIGNCPDGAFRYRGESYAIPNHGFARDMMFKRTANTDESVTFTLVSDASTKKQYPFDFSFGVTYRLDAFSVITDYTVTNTGRDIMYFSVGGHAGFNTPLVAGETKEDFDILFEKEETASRRYLCKANTAENNDEAFTGALIRITKDTFAKGALAFANLMSRRISLVSRKSNHGITLVFDEFPFFGIWSPSAEASFICLEPWHGIMQRTDASPDITVKEGIRMLEPGKTFTTSYRIIVF
ncbi:MAG: aldose 1-epimerase family protein [Spirochaetes bacterium]|nr:aldose 1-epimerase family protein [Spirochaetota bacterium]